MSEILAPTGMDVPSPTLSARLRELGDFFAAPDAGRLTEEQRALSLAIARRLVAATARRIDRDFDSAALWADWLAEGLPGGERLACFCFARGEEHRWRARSAWTSHPRGGSPPAEVETEREAKAALREAEQSEADEREARAYLALQIADRARFDAAGQPTLTAQDLDSGTYRALLNDMAGWRLERLGGDPALARQLGDHVRAALDEQAAGSGIDAAGRAYHQLLVTRGRLRAAAQDAAERHDWPTLLALIAASRGRSYAETSLAVLTAESAALAQLCAPLELDAGALAQVEASLARLPARAVDAGGAA